MNARRYFEGANLPSPDGSGAATRRLCVVSRHPVVSGVFVAGLTTALGARDELEIIVDRRRGGPPTDRPSFERRHRDHVVRALQRDGFAVVPIGMAEPSPIERLAEETYERKLERILWLKRGRIIRLSRWLILSGLLNAILILFFVAPAVKARLTQARPAVSPPSIVAPVGKVGEPPSTRQDARR
jgi:hypothetical protein